MTFFFAALALDIRYDMRPSGPLGQTHTLLLPLIGALGGIVTPAVIATLCSLFIPHAPSLKGWAIPTATDAAFTVPILALLPKVPSALRSFLMALAVFDDLGAVLILALFYGHTPHMLWLCLSSLPILGLLILRQTKRSTLWLFLALTLALWIGLYKAGIEPTLAGVVFGLCFPTEAGQRLSQKLTLPVNLLILPLFAFASTGIDLRHCNSTFLFSAPLISAALGLWIGKPIGISGILWLARRLRLIPSQKTIVKGPALLGISMICGIGFTMSLLITSLAYADHSALMEGRCGVLVGSVLSAFSGWIVLRWCLPSSAKTNCGSQT